MQRFPLKRGENYAPLQNKHLAKEPAIPGLYRQHILSFMQEDEEDNKHSVKEHEMWDMECSSEEEQRMDLIQEGRSEDDATEKGERRGDTGLEPGMRKEWGVEMQDEEEGEPQGKDDATEKGERRGDTGLEPGMTKEWGVEMQDEEEGASHKERMMQREKGGVTLD